MSHSVFEKELQLPVSPRRLWEWHLQPGAFERLAPPWQRMLLEETPKTLAAGSDVVFRVKVGPFSKRWHARIREWDPPRAFLDEQKSGPFAFWEHRHAIGEKGQEASLLDHVEYALPPLLSGIPGAKRLANKEIRRLFKMRHARMTADLTRFPDEPPGKGRCVLVTGATGLIGRRLVPYLKTLGFQVRQLTRSPQGREGAYIWDPGKGHIDDSALDGVYGVIHLAGESIAGGLWTRERKRAILESRTKGTRCLVDALSRPDKRPEVFVSASGVNYYPFDDTVHDEDASSGDSFLGNVCRQWEAEALRVREAGSRCVCVRTGIVLDPLGGALGKMLPAFRLGLGGPIGSGRQGFPWISVDELLDVYVAGLIDTRLSGPVNAVNPHRVDQGAFSRILGKTLGMPAVLPLPAGLVRLALGQMGRETLLAHLHVRPGRLESIDFPFRHDSLDDALSFLLGR